MSKKIRNILIVSILVIIVVSGMLIFNVLSNGFKVLTFSTDNLLVDHIEGILSKNEGIDYSNKIKNVGYKEFEDEYLAFYEVKDSEDSEYIIVDYDKKGNLGENKILNLERIVKGNNSVAMIDMDNNNTKKYIILSGLDNSKFSAINIINSSTEEVIEEVSLEKDELLSYNVENLDNNNVILEYIPETNVNIKLELVKKSGE